MLKNIIALVMLLLLTSLPALAAPAAYSSVIEDLPLMPGMVEKTDEAVVFDKPGGRIVETSAEITAAALEIENFYRQTLPSLGWKALPSAGFVREEERLTLSIEKRGDAALVHFNLKPDHEGK